MQILFFKFSIMCICTYLALNIYMFVNRRRYRKIRSPSIAKTPIWFMGHVLEIQKKLKQFPDKGLYRVLYGYLNEHSCDMLVLFFFGQNFVLCKDLQIFPHLFKNPSIFFKKDQLTRAFESIAGVRLLGKYGMLFDVGTNVWVTKRRIMDPAFNKAFLKSAVDGMGQVGRNLVGVLRTKADTGSTFNITKDIDRSALEAISLCGFDWSPQMMQEYGDIALQTSHLVFEAVSTKFKGPTAFKLPWNCRAEKKKIRKLLPMMREIVKKHLEKMEKSSSKNDNILSHIIHANNQLSDQLTIEDSVDEYFVFLIAGLETTSSTLACAIWYISLYPRVYKKLQTEVDEVFGDKDELDYEDVGKLAYLEMVIKETLRLKGPAHGTSRHNKYTSADINGIHFPKGTTFIVPFKSLHVDPKYWENPQDFIPERFSRESIKNITPYTYMPFSAGPRNCIGKNFAMLNLKITISKIIKEFVVVNPDPDVKELQMLCTITERPKYGVKIKLFSK